jgi:hypothetical protein
VSVCAARRRAESTYGGGALHDVPAAAVRVESGAVRVRGRRGHAAAGVPVIGRVAVRRRDGAGHRPPGGGHRAARAGVQGHCVRALASQSGRLRDSLGRCTAPYRSCPQSRRSARWRSGEITAAGRTTAAYLAAHRPPILDCSPSRCNSPRERTEIGCQSKRCTWPSAAALGHVADVKDGDTVLVRLVALDAYAADMFTSQRVLRDASASWTRTCSGQARWRTALSCSRRA